MAEILEYSREELSTLSQEAERHGIKLQPDMKPFNENLKKTWDTHARKYAIEFLESQGAILIPEGELFKLRDFKMKAPSGQIQTYEVECKLGWDCDTRWTVKRTSKSGECYGESCQYETIHVPCRTKNMGAEIFIMVNRSGTMLAQTTVANVKQSEVVHIDTCWTTHEAHFDVPLEKWDFFLKKDGRWIKTDKNGRLEK